MAAVAFVLSAARARPNILFFAVDDLRPQFGSLYATEEVKTPHMDAFFGNGTAMQRQYVNIAVCGPSRSSMLTSRRPDTTRVGVGPGGWCWCQRSQCRVGQLFMTLPTYLRAHGYATSGNGKLFHPDACARHPGFGHPRGDDPRAWSDGYTVEANVTQEQWGSIPGPHDPLYNGTMGVSWVQSELSDEQTTDGILATDAVERIGQFSRAGLGGAERPFFLSVGLHKPHLPHVAPKKYFEQYPLEGVSLAPNRYVPKGFKEENWHADGNREILEYTNARTTFAEDNFSFTTPADEHFSREQRRGYFAAVSLTDANFGRVVAALEEHGFVESTIVLLWGDHGYHLGDTNSWCKMSNFESACHNTMLWRVPNQAPASVGKPMRITEAIDIFPTLVELAGVPPLPRCTGLDQPPTVDCVQGESYADLFLGTVAPRAPKAHAFSQWPYPKWGPQQKFRMGYTVRSADLRFTEYVPYLQFKGDWSNATADDIELYDYRVDPHETANVARDPKYAAEVATLRGVLRAQYASEQ